MANSRIRPKVRRRKVAHLAAYSRQFTVHNNTIPKTELNQKKLVTIWHEIHTANYDVPVYGKMFEIDKDGHYSLIERKFDPTPMFISDGRPKQPKRLKKGEYKDYTIPKMNKVQYMEKLVEHKTAKWERKNPKPMDMFAEEVEKWKQLRETAIERIRDFVVSVYDPLLLTGRFVLNKENNATYKEEQVALIKDINGEGHKVNALPKTSKLIKKAQKVTDETKAKRPNLVCTNLRDHKRKTGRILLPKAA